MPAIEVPAPREGLKVGDLVRVQTTSFDDPFYTRVAEVRSSSRVIVDSNPAWLRVGQHVAHRTLPTRSGVVVGVLERIVCRMWAPNTPNEPLGSQFEVPLKEFVQDWKPIYTDGSTRQGSRFRNLQDGMLYTVVYQNQGQSIFVLRDVNGVDVILGYYRIDPNEWLYEGPPLESTVLTFGLGLERPNPTRFNREEPL